MDTPAYVQELAKAYIKAVYLEDPMLIAATKHTFDIGAKRIPGVAAQLALQEAENLYSYSTNGHLGYMRGKNDMEQLNAHLHAFHAAYEAFSISAGLPYFTFEQVQARIAADTASKNALKY